MSKEPAAKILVVDNTRESLHFLAETLSDQGYTVWPAASGRQALASAQAQTPDLILLDVATPDVNGYQICETLKTDPLTHDIPVIFLSALDEELDKVKAFAAGGVDYITKPYQAGEVLARVETHLALRKLQKDLQAKNAQLEQEIAERRQSEEALHRYTERLEIRHEIELSIVAARLPETISVATISRLRRLIPYSHAMVLSIEGSGQIELLAAQSADDIGAPVDTQLYQEVLKEQVLRLGLVQGNEDLEAQPRRSPFKQALYAAGIRSYVIIPLFIEGELIGTLHLESAQPRAFTSEHIAIATEVGVSLAVAIRQARLHEQMQREVVERRESEHKIRQQKDLLENTIESLSHPFYVVNAEDYSVEIANSAALSHARRMEATTCHALLHQSEQPCRGSDRPCPLEQVRRTKKPVAMEHVLHSTSAEPRYVEVHGHPIVDGDGRVIRMIEYVLDLTERKQAEQALRESAAVAERERLARDLHDAVTQTLFSASLIAEVLPQIWDTNPVQAKQNLVKLRELTRAALAEMRTLLLELRPTALTEKKLGTLLEHLSETLTSRSKVPVAVTLEGECSPPPDVQVSLYRIAQEALNNIAKHAGAGQAHLTLACQTDRIELMVSDDGCGFDPTSVEPDHLGISIMRERATKIGALFRLDSNPGRGTQVRVVWQQNGGRPHD
ncbi:MAG: response regulator [Anaerolineae bacterium]|jgi:signal transduction histidine kinase/DNA-binding NarL/FixJ family response regulator